MFKKIQTLSGPTGNVISVSINYDHDRIVAGSLDRKIRIYEKEETDR